MEYTVSAAARATGVTEDRLRTWERRYGVPAPPRTGSGRRLYGEADLAVIRRMAALMDSGLSAASAAAAVHEQPPAAVQLPVELDPRCEALVQAAHLLDDTLLLDLLAAGERALGVEAALDHIVLPALIEAGRRWERGGLTVAQEHLLSEAIRTWLVFHSYQIGDPEPDAPRLLVGCPEDERHDLGAFALALLLRLHGMRVTYVGADVPTAALVDAVQTVPFDAVCLSVTAATSVPTARLACAALLSAQNGVRLYIGGRAIVAASDEDTAGIPAVRLPATLRGSVDLIAAQLNHTPPSR